MRKASTDFGDRLFILRENADISQVELAQKAGLAPSGLVKIEQGTTEPHWPSVVAIVEALGCPPEVVFPSSPMPKIKDEKKARWKDRLKRRKDKEAGS